MTRSPPRILLAYDGSTLSERALERAGHLALERGDPVTVIVTMPPRLWRGKRAQFDIPLESRDEEFARGQLARALDTLERAGVKVEGRLRTGAPATAIAQESGEGYETIVMGDRANPTGARSLGQMVRDQVACEVILVP